MDFNDHIKNTKKSIFYYHNELNNYLFTFSISMPIHYNDTNRELIRRFYMKHYDTLVSNWKTAIQTRISVSSNNYIETSEMLEAYQRCMYFLQTYVHELQRINIEELSQEGFEPIRKMNGELLDSEFEQTHIKLEKLTIENWGLKEILWNRVEEYIQNTFRKIDKHNFKLYYYSAIKDLENNYFTGIQCYHAGLESKAKSYFDKVIKTRKIFKDTCRLLMTEYSKLITKERNIYQCFMIDGINIHYLDQLKDQIERYMPEV